MTQQEAKKIIEEYSNAEEGIKAGDISVIRYLGAGYGDHVFLCKIKGIDYDRTISPVSGKPGIPFPEIEVTEDGKLLSLPL